jgi:hypothetical protein
MRPLERTFLFSGLESRLFKLHAPVEERVYDDEFFDVKKKAGKWPSAPKQSSLRG